MSDSVVWTSRYSLDINKIDEQHKHLFELANRVFRLPDDNSKSEVRTLLVEFNEYMKTHFRDEEEYMESINFPELEYHKQLHSRIIDHVNGIIKETKSIVEIKQKMKDVTKKYLVEHIIDEDMKMKSHQEHGEINTYLDDIGNETSV
jgi:hemerythrin